MFKGWLKEQVSDLLDTVKEEAKQKYDMAMDDIDAKIHSITELIECYKISITMEMQEEFKKVQEIQTKIQKEIEEFKSRFGKL